MDLVKDLSKRQKEIFDFIGRYLKQHGYPPTVREIGKAVGLHSSSTVHAHLSKLESLGVLKRDPSKPRAMEVMVERAKRAVKPSGLPLVGTVAAGAPVLAEENIEDYLEVPQVIGGETGDFVLRVEGAETPRVSGRRTCLQPQRTCKPRQRSSRHTRQPRPHGWGHALQAVINY